MPRKNRFRCKQCGEEVERLSATQFCSHACAMTYRHAQAGHNQPITFACGWCGTAVERLPHYAGRARFCSRACAAAQGRANYVPIGKVTVTCVGCGVPFEKWRKDANRTMLHFHDLDCRRHYGAAQAAERAAIPKRLRQPRQGVEIACLICERPFIVPPSQARGSRYCSLACKDVGQSRVQTGRRKVETWKSSAFRGMVRALFIDRCAICGWDEALNDVAHIEARKHGGADTIENIVMLCPNHHRLYDRGKISRATILEARPNCLRHVITPASESS